MGTLRSKEAEEVYSRFKSLHKDENSCRFCDEIPLKEFKYWKILENKFPYDLIAEKHTLLIPTRHIPEDDFNEEEIKELKEIKKNFVNEEEYNYIIESTSTTRSVLGHFHYHLLKVK